MILKIFFLFIISLANLHALEVPRLTGPVVDQAGVFSKNFINKASSALTDYNNKGVAQMQILTVKSLEGEVPENFTIKVVDQWKLGKKGQDNGVLIFLSLEDRVVRIEVGRGLEGNLTDAMSGRIIQAMLPYFRENAYETAFIFALNQISTTIGQDLVTTPPSPNVKQKREDPKSLIFYLVIILIILFIGRGPGAFIAYGGGRRGSFGGSFPSSRGPRWGGGGGGFGGGGATGRW